MQAFDAERSNGSSPAEKAFWDTARRELGQAMIGTIDGLCSRILREFHWEDKSEYPIEPDFEPLDSYEQALLQDEAIDRVLNRASTGDEPPRTPEQMAVAWWSRREGLTRLTTLLRALLNDAVEPAQIAAAHRDLPSPEERCERIWSELPAVAELREHRDRLRQSLEEICTLAGDNPKGVRVPEYRAKACSILGKLTNPVNDQESLNLLWDLLITKGGECRGTSQIKLIAEPIEALQKTWAPLFKEWPFDRAGEIHAMQAADHLACLLALAHQEYLTLCREANRYAFLTLARHTRDLVRDGQSVRAALRQRYRHVMVDEFQDTNPLQWEILSWIVGQGPDGELEPDRLFVVGDPQQSIFRFRKADVRLFRQIEALVKSSNEGHGLADKATDFDRFSGQVLSNAENRLGFVPLAENYRSLAPMPLALMDAVFRHTFDPDIHGLDLKNDFFEIEYQPLESGLLSEKCGEVRYVRPLDETAEETDEEQGDEGEATAKEELAKAQVEAVADQLAGLIGTPRLVPAQDPPVNLKWQDMAVLLPTRTVTLTALESALRRRNIPFVVTGGIGFWQRQEVLDLVNLASWLADPGDDLALFVVLRSPLALLTDGEILFLSQLGRRDLGAGLDTLAPAGPANDSLAVPPRIEPALRQALETTWQDFGPERRAHLRTAARNLARWRQESIGSAMVTCSSAPWRKAAPTPSMRCCPRASKSWPTCDGSSTGSRTKRPGRAWAWAGSPDGCASSWTISKRRDRQPWGPARMPFRS